MKAEAKRGKEDGRPDKPKEAKAIKKKELNNKNPDRAARRWEEN